MPLVLAQPSRKCWRFASDTLQSLGDQLQVFLDRPRAQYGALELGAAHELYVLAAGDLDRARPRRARKAGWRFLLWCGGRPCAALELEQDGREFQRPCLVDSPCVTGFARAVAAAESFGGLGRERWKVAELRVPARYARAVWLRGRRDDWFFPIPPTFERCAPYDPLDAEAFCAALADPGDPAQRKRGAARQGSGSPGPVRLRRR